MGKIQLAVGLILFFAGLFVCSGWFFPDMLPEVGPTEILIGMLFALVGFALVLRGIHTGRDLGLGRKGGLQGVVKNLKREGNLVNFWLEVSGHAGKAVPVEAYLKEDAIGEGDTVWVKGGLGEGGILRTSEVHNLTRSHVPYGPVSPQLMGGGTVHPVVRALLVIAWLILSTMLTLIITVFVVEGFLLDLIYDQALYEGIGWLVLIVTFLIFQVVMYKSRGLSFRERLPRIPAGISAAEGVFDSRGGVFDSRRGVLEATARNVYRDEKLIRTLWSEKVQRVERFRAELTDSQGNITQYIPVEIECEQAKWVGQITEGDKVRLQGKYGRDGILHAQRAINLSTNSIVGKK